MRTGLVLLVSASGAHAFSFGTPASTALWVSPAPAQRAAAVQCRFGFTPQQLAVGEHIEGIVSKITDYGCFVSLCGGQQLGLLHIRDLADGVRMPKDEVEDFVEEVAPSDEMRDALAAPSTDAQAPFVVCIARVEGGRPARLDGWRRSTAARV